jgi:hypothetical protein
LSNFQLANGEVTLEFSAETGAILSCRHSGLGLELIREPRLAENWRLLVKLPTGNLYLKTAGQRLTACTIENGQASLEWLGLDSPDGRLPITVRQHVELQGSTLSFRLEVENDSDSAIEEVYPALLGGMANWEEPDDWYLCVPGLAWGGDEFAFYREFPGSYIGMEKPVFAYTYPGTSVDFWQQNLSMSWASLYHKRQKKAVYFGNHNPEVAMSAFWGEINPCGSYANPRGRWGPQAWPHPSQTEADVPIGAAVGWMFFAFLAAGGRYQSPPVVVRFHEGDWSDSAAYFRAWFNREVSPVQRRKEGIASWDAWQISYLAMPDGRIRYRFTDLPEIASHAKAAGMPAIMIGGWHFGGLDTNYPRLSEPNARLGTPEELAEGIRACRELGVEVILWTNANQMSVDTDWYRDELHKFAIQNPYGQAQPAVGYGFDSLLNMLGYTVHRMVAGNLAHPEFRSLISSEWHKVAQYGPSAMLIDKVISGEPYHLDFNRNAPGRIESSAHRALIDTIGEFAGSLPPGMTLGLETAWDRMMPHAQVTYTRYFGQDHIPVQEIVFPEVKPTCCILGDFDYGLVNNCLRFGHIIATEARYLMAGTVEDLPHLKHYIREALRLRHGLMDNLWWADFVLPSFARIEHGGAVKVGAFRSWNEQPESGSRLALVLHHFNRGDEPVRITFADPSYRSAVLHRPFAEPERVSLPVSASVPQDRVLIVLPMEV